MCAPRTTTSNPQRECAEVLEGRMNVEQAKVEMRRRTRVFVRRQANWFKESDPQIKWFRMGEGTAEEIEAVVRGFLLETA